MGKAQVAWARKKRNEFHVRHGRQCAVCKRKYKGKKRIKLQIDIIEPVNNDHHRKMSWDQRMRFYLREEKKNNARLTCETCNGSKGATHDKAYYAAKRAEIDYSSEPSDTVLDTVTEEVPF